MPRKPARPAAPRFTARVLAADLDPRSCIVDPAFADKLQTRHTRRFTVACEPGDEFTRDVPNVAEHALAHLDERGLATTGSAVRPGTILAGKVSPIEGGPLSPEEKLLRAIFGEAAGSVRDTSLRAPSWCTGEVDLARGDDGGAELVVAWDRPLVVGDHLLVDGEALVVADIRPLSADLARAGDDTSATVVKGALARDACTARSIGPYDPRTEQPTRDRDGLAGQVVDVAAIAALAGAAPWAAFELLTIKSDCPTVRSRVSEAMFQRKRPDATPRTAAPPPSEWKARVPLTSTHRDIFDFFAGEPGPGPDEVAAFQPEVVGMIVLHLRALGLEVDLRVRAPGVTVLSAAQVVETSRGEVVSADDLASQRIFGPVTDYTCACNKHRRMRDRGVVCDECGVEVIHSRVRRERCGHIVLATPCEHPLLAGERLEAVVVLPPDLRGPGLDAAYTRVLAAPGDELQAAVDAVFAAIARVVDRELHPRMYSKAVDFSGAAHLVVDSSLAADECRVPRELLRELFRPHAYGLLEAHGYTTTIKGARRMVELGQPEALAAIAEASEGSTVLLIADAVVVARRVRAWDAPAIAVDRTTADRLGAALATIHVPLTHQAAATIAGMDDPPRAPRDEPDGWLAQARRDARLVDAAVQAARSGERDPIDDIVVQLALGRAPAAIDDAVLDAWQFDDDARQQALHAELAPPVAAPPANPHLDRNVDELELGVRAASGLAELGITTIGALCSHSEADLRRSRQFGPKALAEVKAILAELGLSLGMPQQA